MSITSQSKVRIGAGPSRLLLVLWVGLSFLFALMMKRITPDVPGLHPIALGAILLVLGLVWIGAVLYRYTPSRATVDFASRTLKSGWRTVPFSELQHVYRLPGGADPRTFGIRIGVRRGPDVRVVLNSANLVNAKVDEVKVLIALVEAAPVVPDPKVPLRPPLGTELGTRSDGEIRDDAAGSISMLYYDTSYAKATLLLELQQLAQDDPPMLPAASPAQRVVQELLTTVGQMPVGRPGSIPAANTVATANNWSVDYNRGFFGTLSARFRQDRDRAEAWLRETDPDFMPDKHGRIQALGWLALVVVLFWPLSFIVALAVLFSFPGTAAYSLMVIPAILLVFSPITLWAAFVMFWLARVRRHRSLRTAVLAARARRAVPDEVRAHFGSPHPEGYIELPVVFLLTFAWIATCAGGIMVVLFGILPSPGSPAIGLVPVGLGLVLLSVALFRKIVGRLARQRVASLLGELDYRMMAPNHAGAPS